MVVHAPTLLAVARAVHLHRLIHQAVQRVMDLPVVTLAVETEAAVPAAVRALRGQLHQTQAVASVALDATTALPAQQSCMGLVVVVMGMA